MAPSKRIHVNLDKCVGSRICLTIAPKVFALNGDGQATVIDPEGDSMEVIRMAAEGCPLAAITIQSVDDETSDS